MYSIYSYVVIMPCFIYCMISGYGFVPLRCNLKQPGYGGKATRKPMRLSTRDRFDWGPGHRLEVRVTASVQSFFMQKLLLSQNVE